MALRKARRQPRLVLLALLAAVLCSVGAVHVGRAEAADSPVPQKRFVWMITLRSLRRLTALPGSDAAVKTFFGSQRYSILVGGPHSRYPSLPARRSLAFGSYRSMHSGVASSPSPHTPRVVILDLERWSQTPPGEQRQPARYYRLAGRLARRKGLLLVATPSSNLVEPWPVRFIPAYVSYLQSGLVGEVAKAADVFEVQAQGFERQTALYKEFVANAADQARDANPHVTVIAGLSTNPGGRGVPAIQLYRDALAARPYVDGFWLNIPAKSQACRRCGVARPEIALELLRKLMHDSAFLPGARPVAATAGQQGA